MKPVVVPGEVADAIRTHARATYPDECCGFLIAAVEPVEGEGERSIVACEPAANEYDGRRGRRFEIRPEELRRVERRLEGTGRAVVGFYHSHPDHPARPSRFDQEHAWPWYTYLVLSVSAAEAAPLGAFELDPGSSEFKEVPLTVTSPPHAPAPVVGR